MAKYDYTFEISISPCGTEYMDYKITKHEMELISEAMDEGCLFADSEELSKLYKKVYNAARNQLASDVELTAGDQDVNENIDVENLNFTVDFTDYPELEE